MLVYMCNVALNYIIFLCYNLAGLLWNSHLPYGHLDRFSCISGKYISIIRLVIMHFAGLLFLYDYYESGFANKLQQGVKRGKREHYGLLSSSVCTWHWAIILVKNFLKHLSCFLNYQWQILSSAHLFRAKHEYLFFHVQWLVIAVVSKIPDWVEP